MAQEQEEPKEPPFKTVEEYLWWASNDQKTEEKILLPIHYLLKNHLENGVQLKTASFKKEFTTKLVVADVIDMIVEITPTEFFNSSPYPLGIGWTTQDYEEKRQAYLRFAILDKNAPLPIKIKLIPGMDDGLGFRDLTDFYMPWRNWSPKTMKGKVIVDSLYASIITGTDRSNKDAVRNSWFKFLFDDETTQQFLSTEARIAIEHGLQDL